MSSPMDFSFPINIPAMFNHPANREASKWVRIWDYLPEEREVVPVWDGEHTYYATCWRRDGKQLWIVVEQVGINLDDIDRRRKQGEQVYPLQWMRLTPPNE